MNIDKVKNIVHKKAKGHNEMSAQLYQMYFFERVLERISISRYKNNIILKGGLLLASIIGDSDRTTKDMDANFKNLALNLETVTEIMNEILLIDLGDNVKFEILGVEEIREESDYNGLRVKILAKLETLRYNLAVEISTGDKITPREVAYSYKSIFEEKTFRILSYTIETIIAEKYHCIITRGVFNTRMKDYYDIHVLLQENGDKINTDTMNKAIKNTFKKRESSLKLSEISEVINDIKESSRMRNLWTNFQSKAPYAKEIEYLNLFDSLDFISLSLRDSEKT